LNGNADIAVLKLCGIALEQPIFVILVIKNGKLWLMQRKMESWFNVMVRLANCKLLIQNMVKSLEFAVPLVEN